MTSNNKPRRGALRIRPIVSPDRLQLFHSLRGSRRPPIPLTGIPLSGISEGRSFNQ